MHATGYVRLSELTEATVSPDSQRAAIQAWADSHSAQLVAIHEDLDLSGRRGVERPAFTQALEDIHTGRAQVLVVAKLDRLARSVVSFHEALAIVEAAGGHLVSAAESLDFSTPSGRMVASVLSSFAEYESDMISGRVKAAQDYLATIGRWRGGRRPYGMQPTPHPSGTGSALSIHPDEEPVVRDMIRRALAGDSLTAIARHLNEDGVRTANGLAWGAQGVRHVLTREGLHGAGGVEPYLGAAEWVELQKALTTTPQPKARKPAKGLLTSVVCGRCGKRMACTWVGRYRLYRCTRQHHPGAEGQCACSAVADRVEAEVERQVLARYGSVAVSRPPEDQELEDPAADTRAELQAALEALEEDRYLRGLYTGAAGADRFAQLHASITERLEQLPEPQPLAAKDHQYVLSGRTLAEDWADASHEERQAILDAILDHVSIGPAKHGAGRWQPERVQLTWAP